MTRRSNAENQIENEEDLDDETREKYRKMIHLKSEHKRRAQIHSGFERVRMELPVEFANRKMSKNEILTETIRYLDYLEDLASPYLTS